MIVKFLPERTRRPFKYLISGGSAAIINVGSLFLLTHLAHVWYLLASIIGFLLSFVASFLLQRYWTFEVNGADTVAAHALQYLAIALVNLIINTALVFGLVEWFGVWYVGAQIIAGIVLALESFFVYRYIFRS